MARARNIKPGFYKNEDLAECSIWARFIFPGLWMLADREGRLEDRPKRIKNELLGFDCQEVEPLLVELEEHGFLERYQNSDGRFIQISKFKAHQSPHYSEKSSVIKPNYSEKSSVIKNEGIQDEPENTPGVTNSLRGGRNPLNPDSLNPDSLNPELFPSSPVGEGDLFPQFWEIYPRKVGKDAAVKAFAKRKPDKQLLDCMVKAIFAQGLSEKCKRGDGQFVPHPATWLNEGRWLDEVDQKTKPQPEFTAKPKWVIDAGFVDVADANSSRCYEHNAHQFHDGKRSEVEA